MAVLGAHGVLGGHVSFVVPATANRDKAKSRLLPSGLLGPVTLQIFAE